MKKLLKIMACTVMFFALVGIMSSCKESFGVKVYYTAALDDHNLNNQEINNLNDYFSNHRIMRDREPRWYDVSSKESFQDCYVKADELARNDFNNLTGTFDEEELRAIISAGKYFTYKWTRSDKENGHVTVCEWSFVAE